MIIDSSAVIAILRGETDTPALTERLVAATSRRMSAGTFLETAIVADRDPNPLVGREFDQLVREARIQIIPVTETQAHIARKAYRDFGRGSGHPARLNFGDCLAYALAIDAGEPLLFRGDDFGHTDVRSALAET